MLLTGSYTLKADLEKVWNFISNPKEIANCFPGLVEFKPIDGRSFTVTVRVSMSIIKGDFKLTFSLLDQTPPTHSEFEATGRGAGISIQMKTSIDLSEPQTHTTELSWKSNVEIGGLLGELSPGLIQSSAEKIMNGFFDSVRSKVESK